MSEATHLGAAIARAGVEARALDRLALELQRAVGDALGAATDAGSDVLELQRLDYLQQSLAGLADFLARLADETPDACRADATRAAATVRLRDLARRLAGESEDEIGPADAGGDVDFF